MLKDELKKIGLSANEAAVYIASLELGASSISEIARKAGIQRPQMYQIIDGLSEKHLISKAIMGKRSVYIAETPAKLKELLKEKLGLVDNILPELVALENISSLKPKIRYIEGVSGIKDAYLGAVGAKEKQLIAFVGVESLTQRSRALEGFWDGEFKSKRKKNGVIGKIIIPDNKAGKDFQKKDDQNSRESRLVPASTYNFPAEILAYDTTVVFISYTKKEEFALSLESEAIAKTVKMIWKIVWNVGY